MSHNQPQFSSEEQRQWDADNIEINKIIESGHSRHCACRQVWGDGECECDLYKQGYNPYGWMGKILKDVEPNLKKEL